MKLMVLNKRPASNGATGSCRHCSKTMKVGELALHQKMPNNPYGDRDMFFHVECVDKVLLAGPDMKQKLSVAAQAVVDDTLVHIRERMLETGDPFVDC